MTPGRSTKCGLQRSVDFAIKGLWGQMLSPVIATDGGAPRKLERIASWEEARRDIAKFQISKDARVPGIKALC